MLDLFFSVILLIEIVRTVKSKITWLKHHVFVLCCPYCCLPVYKTMIEPILSIPMVISTGL